MSAPMLLAEFLGTFVLLCAVLSGKGEIAAAAGLLAAAFAFGRRSGHFNPVVSLVQVMRKVVTAPDAAKLVVAQALGAVVAMLAMKRVQGGDSVY